MNHTNRTLCISTVDQLIDDVIQSEANSACTERLFAEILSALPKNDSSGEFASVRLSEIDRTSQRQLVASFLRILPLLGRMGLPVPTESKIFELFDEVLEQPLYRLLKLSKRDQRHEKELALKSIAESTEARIRAILSHPPTFANLSAFRHAMMQELNNPYGTAIVKPFLSEELVGHRLNTVFSEVETYQAKSTSEVRAAYSEALDTLSSFSNDAHALRTRYGREFLGGIADALSELLDRDFADSAASQPAGLILDASEKRYPFHATLDALDLELHVRNLGAGHAYGTELTLDAGKEFAEGQVNQYVGHLRPGESVRTICRVRVTETTIGIEAFGQVTWKNSDETQGSSESIVEFKPQRTDTDWKLLETSEPFSLEPVTDEDELVGRVEILRRLGAAVSRKRGGSCIVHGQKRVGKTSIVRIFSQRLQKSDHFRVIYLEGGQYREPKAESTVAALGRLLCRQVRRSDSRLSDVECPTFDDALAPFDQFMDRVNLVTPELRFVFVLDEFDELPLALFRRGEQGNSFFLTLRGLSNREDCNFVLVGGEKMDLILSAQGTYLNKFDVHRVDYFDRQQHWPDFQDLVRNPIENQIDVTDSAIVELYYWTAGNPYFVKLIGRELVSLMIDRRDSHVTDAEIRLAKDLALRNISQASFQHFWEDGILEEGPQVELVSQSRRKALLALAKAMGGDEICGLNEARQAGRLFDLVDDEMEIMLKDFNRRKILGAEGECTKFKVPFFGNWLKEYGGQEVLLDVIDDEGVKARIRAEDDARIRPDEIVSLAQSWDLYQGRRVSEDLLRAWLNQFGDPLNQRYMFRILKSIDFYSNDRARSKMREAHQIALRDTRTVVKLRQRKTGNIIVTYLDSPAKSGARYAKLYADENQILSDRVMPPDRVGTFIQRNEDISAVVVVDDLIGTGTSASEFLVSFASDQGDVLAEAGIKLLFTAIAGHVEAVSSMKKRFRNSKFEIVIHTCNELGEPDKCFGQQSRAFPDSAERDRARALALEYGHKLFKEPLGYGDCQFAVVFDETCPNNSLPILWSDRNGWIPLFPRR